MIIAGIDEAGYGPLLGPLVVTGVAWEIPDELAQADLWQVLAASIARTPGRGELRLPVADSKALYDRKEGLVTLERTALTMLRAAGHEPGSLRALLRLTAGQGEDQLQSYPWYCHFDCDLPAGTTSADIGTRANAVRRDLAACGIRPLGVFIELLPEGHFNQLVLQTRNKATVLLQQTLRIVQRILDRTSGPVRLCLDRHGGRVAYVEALMTFHDGAELKVLEESPQRSAYGLTTPARHWTAEFLTHGEARCLLIALASIYSKYLRELLMEGLNGYFAGRVQGLAPTAGYYTDAQRFLADVAATLEAERIDRAMFVRSR